MKVGIFFYNLFLTYQKYCKYNHDSNNELSNVVTVSIFVITITLIEIEAEFRRTDV